MKILFHCGYHPSDPGSYLEKALSRKHEVTYCGPAYKFERPGFPKDLDLSNIEKKWDFFFYVDSYCPGFPLGIKKMPFPTVGYFLDTVYGVKTKLLIAPFFDYVFVDSKDNIEPFFKVNKNVFWLPYGCDPEIIYCNKNIKKIYDIGFVGTTKGTERGKVLANLAKYFKLNDYERSYTREEMALIYNQSKIIFNQSLVESMTMRTFEALSCGSLLLSKRVKDGADILFKEGEHFVAFGPEDDLIKIIKYYLSHDEEREKIAAQGHELVISKHTYWHRAQTILETLKKNNWRMEAPARSWSKEKLFLRYNKIFSMRTMVEGNCNLVINSDVSLPYKLIGLWYIFRSLLSKLRINRTGLNILKNKLFKND